MLSGSYAKVNLLNRLSSVIWLKLAIEDLVMETVDGLVLIGSLALQSFPLQDIVEWETKEYDNPYQ